MVILIFKKGFIYLFLERGKGRERGRETLIGCLSTGDLAHNSDMRPDRGLNQRPFDLQAGIQSTEPHQPGHHGYFNAYSEHGASEVTSHKQVPSRRRCWHFRKGHQYFSFVRRPMTVLCAQGCGHWFALRKLTGFSRNVAS